MGKKDLDLLKLYAKAVVDEYTFGNDQTHGSLVTYSDRPRTMMSIDDGIDKTHLKNLIDSIDVDDAAPRVERVLTMISSILNRRSNRPFRKVAANVILFTKGSVFSYTVWTHFRKKIWINKGMGNGSKNLNYKIISHVFSIYLPYLSEKNIVLSGSLGITGRSHLNRY